MRSNLLSLQNTQDLMDMTQERLSTGKKVNSAIDNPSSYYTAQSLTNRASDLNALLDSMGQGIQTIQAANEGIETITTFVQQAKAVANSAFDNALKINVPKVDLSAVAKGNDVDTADTLTFTITKISDGSAAVGSPKTVAVATDNTTWEAAKTEITNAFNTPVEGIKSVRFNGDELVVEAADGYRVSVVGAGKFDVEGLKTGDTPAGAEENLTRTELQEQFNEILRQIDLVAKDSGYKGVNLLQENDLTVVFNEDRSSDLFIEGVDASSGPDGLKIARVTDWQNNDNVEKSITETENAINTLRSMASTFGNNYSIVQNREDFTENLINVLEEGADKLTLADMNEESANMLALQTRQQLAINSLSLASQAAQSVLSLFN